MKIFENITRSTRQTIWHIKRHIIGVLLFLFSIIIGLLIYDDYGIAWDELEQRSIGLVSYNFAFNGDTSLNEFGARDYGVAVELPLIIIEKLLNLKDARDIFLMRHLTVHLFFLLSAFVLYWLTYFLYKNKLLAITGYLILLLSPVIYAHSFFNNKDIPFMSMFILCFFISAIAFHKNKIRYFIVAGICCGLLINIRIMGVMILAFTTVFTAIDCISSKGKKKILASYLVYIISLVSALVIFWPYLWENPISNFLEAFSRMSKFPWPGTNLMFGEFIKATDIKWSYIPAWFALTIPIPYLFFGAIGILFVIINFIRRPIKLLTNTLERNQLMYLVCFIGSILSVSVLHSVLYDGWRHMYFIYPSFILLAIYGISSIVRIEGKKLRKIAIGSIIGIFVFTFISTGLFMVKNHPLQNVYFNEFVPRSEQYIRKNFEMDYWGTSYKQALEYIFDKDKSYRINILVANGAPGRYNALMLKEKDRKRIYFVNDLKYAHYFISNYRWHPEDYSYLPGPQFFTIKVLNSDVISVWKIK